MSNSPPNFIILHKVLPKLLDNILGGPLFLLQKLC